MGAWSKLRLGQARSGRRTEGAEGYLRAANVMVNLQAPLPPEVAMGCRKMRKNPLRLPRERVSRFVVLRLTSGPLRAAKQQSREKQGGRKQHGQQ